MDHTVGSGILIYSLEFKLSHFKCFPIIIFVYREAMHLQCSLPTRYVMGTDSHAHERDDLYKICSKVKHRERARTVWLYTMQCSCIMWVFQTIFVLLIVSVEENVCGTN